MEKNVYPFNLGDLACAVIGDFSRVRQARELIANPEEEIPPQVLAREITSDYSCLLVQTGDHQVLFDAGLGERMEYAEGELLANLSAMGL